MIYYQTERLEVAFLKEEHFPLHLELLSNPDVMRYIGSGKPKTEEQTRYFFDLCLNHQKKHGFTMGSVFIKESGEFIGRSGIIYLAMDDQQPEKEIGYALLPKYWGKGYATELAIGALQWGFTDLDDPYFIGIADPENTASQKVLQNAGFSFEGEKTYMTKKAFRYTISRESWEKRLISNES